VICALGETRRHRRQRRAQAVIDAWRYGGKVDDHDAVLLARQLGPTKVLAVDFVRRCAVDEDWDSTG
jgi:hypothetical protein